MTRRRRSTEEVSELLDKFYASGMNRLEYCRHIGIGKSTLDRWIQGHQTRTRFVKVNVKPSPAPGDRAFVLILTNGRRIESNWQFGDSDLARLIRIVETA